MLRTRLAVVFACTALAASGQVCRISAAGLNQNRRAMGPIHAECPPTLHTVPFGNWGVTSNFGVKTSSQQFQGWCQNQRVCDNEGNCSTDCTDGWLEWNSCTDVARWSPPNCTLYNDADCTQQRSTAGTNVHGTRSVDVAVRCPSDTTGDGVPDQGGCSESSVYRSGANFMSLYEIDPGTADELIQTIYYPEVVLNLDCDVWGCAPAGSPWLTPSAWDPASPQKVYAELAVVVNSAVFVDTSRACGARGPELSTVSAASQTAPIAPDSIVTIYGNGLSTETATTPSAILPSTLGGTTVSVTDAGGAARTARLYYVSPRQINFLLPAGTAAGQARVVATRTDSVTSAGSVVVAPYAPALFTANATGTGVAAAIATRITATGERSNVPVYECPGGAGTCVPVPIDLGAPGDSVYLSLYGTGIRNAANTVAVTIAGSAATVSYAGPQNQYPGMDQVNIVLPQSLRGLGQVSLMLRQGDLTANTVTLSIR